MNAPSSAGPVILVLGAMAVVAAVVAIAIAQRKVRALRARGLYPEEERATASDVLRLLHSGEKLMAIRCYRELHKVGLKEAKDAVERLEAKLPDQPRGPPRQARGSPGTFGKNE